MTTTDAPSAFRGPAVRRTVGGGDPDETRAVLEAGFEGSRWEVSPAAGGYGWRHSFLGDGDVGLSALRVAGTLRGTASAQDELVVSWLRSGRPLDLDAPHATVGRPTLLPSERVTEMGYSEFDQRCVHLSRDLVSLVAAERDDLAPGPLAFARPTTLDAGAVDRWWRTVRLVSENLSSPTTSPVLVGEVHRLAAGAFLDLFPATTAATTVPSLLLPRNAHIRAAVEHVHEHAHEDVTTQDLAAVAHLGVRSLQQAFLRHLGMTPTAYLRQVRLDRCRDELLAADPATTMVGDVARRWGFAHLGRFAATYARHHGEYPRDTLHRAR